MQLKLEHLIPSDLDAAKSYHGPETGNLVAAAVGLGWHPDANDLDAQKRRAEWSCQQQKDLLLTDPTTRFVKVVDVDAPAGRGIVATGRWHDYKDGYEHRGGLETTGLKDRYDPATWPEDFNKQFYLGFMDECLDARPEWMGKGPLWVLTNICTREPLRRHGAGSMIIQWGLEQARQAGVHAYLEAVPEVMHLYESHGFREIGRQKVDCTPFGAPGVVVELVRMRADP